MLEFHFLRPWWLLALPAGFALVWVLARGGIARGAWRKVVDGALQPHVLAASGVLRQRRLPVMAALAVWTLATVALAGPAWERLPVPALRDDDALVVVFDLSRSMDAADVEPSRVAQARLKLLALLERRQGGQTALVVFSAHAFTVTPLTTDNRTIAALVGALSTDIMPTQGSVPEAGLERAAQLLRQAGLMRGAILLMTDATPGPRGFESARALAQEGYRVHVLAIGTEQGAPVALAGGGFLTDASGRVVVPGVDMAALRRLATAGGGRFAVLSPDERDLDQLLTAPGAAGVRAADAQGEDFLADVWQDRGPWLVLLVLPLLALGFRRGWIAALALCVALPGAPAHAFEWASLWERSDRRALRVLEEDEPGRAAELFANREWRATAQYRAEDYLASAASLEGLDSARAHYNRGNALARAGLLPAAIAAYERALELDPEHEDARYNRDLLEELLRNNPQLAMPPSAGDDGDPSQEPGDQQSQGGQQEGRGQQDERLGSEGAQADPSAADDASAGESGGQADAGEDPALDPAQADGSGDGGDRPGDGVDDTLGPDDIEQWASEQAVEQWLRRIVQDPGGLLRRKFQYQYQRLGLDQDGNYIGSGDEREPW